jgi:hypothetical protein
VRNFEKDQILIEKFNWFYQISKELKDSETILKLVCVTTTFPRKRFNEVITFY